MAEEVKIEVGDYIIIRDGKEENRMSREGTVNKLSGIAGAKNKRIHCEGPFLIDVEQ